MPTASTGSGTSSLEQTCSDAIAHELGLFDEIDGDDVRLAGM